jgi:hypothetical protein
VTAFFLTALPLLRNGDRQSQAVMNTMGITPLEVEEAQSVMTDPPPGALLAQARSSMMATGLRCAVLKEHPMFKAVGEAADGGVGSLIV